MSYQHPQQPDPRHHQPGTYGQPPEPQQPPQPHYGTRAPSHVYSTTPDPTGQPPKKKSTAPPWLVALTVLLVLGACIGGAVALGGGLGEEDDDPVTTDNSITAEVMCEGFVEDRLKAPASAEFPDPTTTKQGAQYTVIGTVDSQNSFGAMIRNQYTCTVRDEGDEEGTWTLVNMELGE